MPGIAPPLLSFLFFFRFHQSVFYDDFHDRDFSFEIKSNIKVSNGTNNAKFYDLKSNDKNTMREREKDGTDIEIGNDNGRVGSQFSSDFFL